jgi:serine/threonine protein kinase
VSAETRFAAGLRVADNLSLVRPLGQGGMGSVWVADHLTLETQVAVKFISAELRGQEEAVSRFQREASAAAHIKSPHVVQVFDHGLTDTGIPYIAMELLDGEDLGRRLGRMGALPLPLIAEIVTQMCRALSRAHSLGIVHRDIKPDNVFLSEADGELLVKVLDFGIAKRVNDHSLVKTGTGMMLGTPSYMSPEQMLSTKAVDLKSDLWAAGVVTYHMLTGNLPFHAETLGALCVAIERCEFTAPSALRNRLPRAVDAWCARALARDPNQRFGSAREMAEAFRIAAGNLEDASVSGARPALTVPPGHVSTFLDSSVAFTRDPSRAPIFGVLAIGAIGLCGLLAFGAIHFGSRAALAQPPPTAWTGRGEAKPAAEPPATIASTPTTSPRTTVSAKPSSTVTVRPKNTPKRAMNSRAETTPKARGKDYGF